MKDRPVRPAAVGTFHVPTINMTYSAGGVDDTRGELVEILRERVPVACDIETYGLGLDARRLKVVTFATERRAVVLDPRELGQHHMIRKFIPHVPELVFHNSTYDVPNMAAFGLWDVDWCAKVTDTLIYARLAFPDTLEMKSLEAMTGRLLRLETGEPITAAFRRLGWTKAEGYKRMDIDSPMYLQGCAGDAIATARLLPAVRHAAYQTLTTGHPFSDNGVTGPEAWTLVDREQVINRGLLRRSVRGLRVDLDFLDNYTASTVEELERAERELADAGIRPGNGGDLVRVLEERGALPDHHPRTKKTGKPSTVAKHLETLADPLARVFVGAKQVVKIRDDYLTKCRDLADEDGRVHPVVNLLKATTGRMSIGDPPFQQFPGGARGTVLADEGDTLVSIDWAQIEPVVAANIAGDRKALAGYEDGTSDMYTTLAELARVPRKTAKVVLLAQLYGEGLGKLAADLGIQMEEARALRDSIFRALPRTKDLVWKLRDIGEQYRKVFTVSGRILDVPMGAGWDGGPPTVATHKAVNYFVQGSAYDLLAESLVRIMAAGLGDAVYLAMHDELVVSAAAAEDVRRIMEIPPERLCRLAGRVPVLRTDLEVLGERWASA